jgi:uncharacterized membrane protein
MTDNQRRTAKTFTWRCFAGLDTFTIVYITTGHVGASVGVVGIEAVTKLFWYWGHELVWDKMPSMFGRSKS